MKLKEQFREVTSSGLENVHSKFGIQQGAKMFHILSDAMYKNKPRAILRELYANAVDAHKEADNMSVQPIIIMPTELKPDLVIKDFGTGMSNHVMTTLYPTYGATTKDWSNDLIGGLGLGSKSAFSYTDNFVVESIFEGEKRTYQCYITDMGEPAITLVGGAEPTEEHDGITYHIPVERVDINDFIDEARSVFTHFSLKPEIKGVFDSFAMNTVEYEVTADTYGVVKVDPSIYGSYRSRRRGEHSVIMGSIAYPLDFEALKGANMTEDDMLNGYSRSDASINLFFNIGDLDIQPSREGLSYDKNTQRKIIDKFTEITTDLLTEVTTKVGKAKTKWDAFLIFRTMQETMSLIPTEARKVYWFGHKIENKLPIGGENITYTMKNKKQTMTYSDIDLKYVGDDQFKKMRFTYSQISNSIVAHYRATTEIQPHRVRVVRVRSTDNRIPSRLTSWVNKTWGSRNISILVIDTDNDIEATHYIHQVLGNPKVYDFATDVPDYSKVAKANGSKTKASSLYKFEANNRRYWRSSNPTFWDKSVPTVDLDAESGYYVDVRNHQLFYNGNKMDAYHLYDMLVLAVSEGWLGVTEIPTVYGVPGSQKNLMKDHPNWKNILDVLHFKARLHYMKEDISDDKQKREAYKKVVSNLGYTIIDRLDSFTPKKADSPWAKATEIFNNGKDIDVVESKPLIVLTKYKMYFSIPYMPKAPKLTTTTIKNVDILREYPMLALVGTSGDSANNLIEDYVNLIDSKE